MRPRLRNGHPTSGLRSLRRTATITLSTLIIAAACGSSSNDSAATNDSPDDSGTPDSLTVATSFAVNDLLPLDNGQWAPELGYGDLLMKPLPGGELEPWVLQSLESTSDTTWALELRDNVTFQNGNPLDAEVLAELIQWHLDNNTRVPAQMEGTTVEATGDLTLELTTDAPVASLPSVLANEGTFVLFDLATYEGLEGNPDDLVEAGIYTGPYEVTSIGPETMELEPSESYYGGEPALSSVTVMFVPDEQARVRAVQSGEADIALYPPTAAARLLEAGSDARYLTQPEGEATVGMLLFVNQHRGPLADRDVRKALQLAVDYQAIASEVMNGLYDTAVGLYPAFLPHAVESLKTDLNQAEQLLDAAGWGLDDDVRTKDGEVLTLRLLVYPQQPDIGVVGVALQDQLRAVGIDIEVVEVDDIYEALEDPNGWELGISNEHAADLTATDPLRPLANFYYSDGIWNFGGSNNAELDDLIDQLSVTTDEAERISLLQDIQTIVVEDQAYGWYLALKRTPVVVSPALEGYEVPVANLWLSNIA